MRPRPALLIATLAMLLARSAPATPSARLVYSRTPEAAACPGEPALRKAVAARVGYDPFFPWAKQTVVVQIGARRGALGARVEIVDEDGVARGARELTSAQGDCVELFDATALAISIALDAAAAAEPPAPAASTAPVEPPPAPPPAEPAPPLVPSAPAPRDVPLAPPPPRPASFFAGFDALTSINTAPSVAAGGAIFVGARARYLSAALEMRIDAPASTTITGGSVTSWLYAASVVPCAHYGIGSLCAVGTLEEDWISLLGSDAAEGTFEAWVKLGAASPQRAALVSSDLTADSSWVAIWASIEGIGFSRYAAALLPGDMDAGPPPDAAPYTQQSAGDNAPLLHSGTDTSFHHVVGTFGATGCRLTLYIDGATVGTNGECVNMKQWPRILVGAGSLQGTAAVDATIADIAIYGTALTPARVLAHYQAGAQ